MPRAAGNASLTAFVPHAHHTIRTLTVQFSQGDVLLCRAITWHNLPRHYVLAPAKAANTVRRNSGNQRSHFAAAQLSRLQQMSQCGASPQTAQAGPQFADHQLLLLCGHKMTWHCDMILTPLKCLCVLLVAFKNGFTAQLNSTNQLIYIWTL